MAYLVRRITINKWPDGKNKIYKNLNELQADAFADLKTTQNTLSWWRIEDLSQIDLAAMTIISSLNDSTSKICLLAIQYNTLLTKFNLLNTPDNGITAVKDMANNHYDICDLNYKSLGEIGAVIAKETNKKDNPLIFRIKVKDEIEKLKELKVNNKLDCEYLGNFIKDKI